MISTDKYMPKNNVRMVTAASLFDGHDAAINIMRRIIQSNGVEVIHLGHNRSVQEIVDTAIQEDVQSVAITSYQGGHNEFFKYMLDLFKRRGAHNIKIFGGGGGVILPEEIDDLHKYGISRIYSPDDGREMGLQGMINDVVKNSDYPIGNEIDFDVSDIKAKDHLKIARLISAAENYPEKAAKLLSEIRELAKESKIPILGITGTGGAGKSSLVDELVRRFLVDFPDKSIGIISVDPSKRKTGGALLGDRIRMNSINTPRVYMRSLATRQSNLAMSKYVHDSVDILKVAGFDLVILETSGIGQSDTEIIDHSDVSMYVMTPEYGAATQLEKIDMLDYADVVAINKFDKRGALDALRDVAKQYQRNHNLWEAEVDDMPVIGTIASQFNDPGVTRLYRKLIDILDEKTNANFASHLGVDNAMSEKIQIIPPKRVRYLSEISETIRNYNEWTEKQARLANRMQALHQSIEELKAQNEKDEKLISKLEKLYEKIELDLMPETRKYWTLGRKKWLLISEMNLFLRLEIRRKNWLPTKQVYLKLAYPKWLHLNILHGAIF